MSTLPLPDELEIQDRQQLDALFRQRAARLARAPVSAGARGTGMLTATVGPTRIAVRLTGLAEVLPLGRWSQVPGWPPALLGVAARRGSPLPVIDLHHLLGSPAPAPTAASYLLLARCPGGLYGLRVETLGEVLHIPLQTLSEPETDHRARSVVEAVAPDGLVLIDPGRLMAPGGPLARGPI